MKSTVSCDLHDYLEIACMFHYRVTIQLREGTLVTGIAQDIVTTSEDKCEEIILQTDSGRIGVATSNMQKMTVLTEGARFQEVNF
ncbi:MAG: Rho-binding antiterminator [Aestuariibacter sp.]